MAKVIVRAVGLAVGMASIGGAFAFAPSSPVVSSRSHARLWSPAAAAPRAMASTPARSPPWVSTSTRRSSRSLTTQMLLGGLFDREESTTLGKGMTVAKIQVCLNSPDRSRSSVLAMLANKADSANTETSRGLARLISDVGLELLRREPYWIGANTESTHYGGRDAPEKAEVAFERMLNSELVKFEKEYLPPPGSAPITGGSTTYVVVSLLVAIRGDKTAFGSMAGQTSSGTAGALQMLGADAMTEGGDLLIAAEVLWTPSEDDEVLEKRDVIVDYPEIIDF
mmetsp:Transcript_110255/g.321113  ORF Transcript_110255/g.321113 Transcript_110255/m.321113 type:complete len:282 (+) Transcript_110255:63-908(+)